MIRLLAAAWEPGWPEASIYIAAILCFTVWKVFGD